MGKVLNIEQEQKKKEVKELLKQVDASTWDKPTGQYADFLRRGKEYRENFAKKYKLDSNNDKAILYKICDVLKKKKKVDYDMCWLSHTACNIITNLTTKDNMTVKNDFFIKRNNAFKNMNRQQRFDFLLKNRKIWLNEIQLALDTKDYNLLLNGDLPMMIYSGISFERYEKKKNS